VSYLKRYPWNVISPLRIQNNINQTSSMSGVVISTSMRSNERLYLCFYSAPSLSLCEDESVDDVKVTRCSAPFQWSWTMFLNCTEVLVYQSCSKVSKPRIKYIIQFLRIWRIICENFKCWSSLCCPLLVWDELWRWRRFDWYSLTKTYRFANTGKIVSNPAVG